MTLEYRTASGGTTADGNSLSGLVTPFNSETTIGDLSKGGFREQIAPGAFTKTLQERDVVLLFNHNSDMPLARKSAGNLNLRQAGDGLRVEATPVQTSYGKDLIELIRSGVLRGMSFGFEVVKDSWTDDEGRASNSAIGTRRTVQEVKLHEVSAVTFPAYQNTSLTARDTVNAARGIAGARDSGQSACTDCGEFVGADDTECPNCGRELDESDSDGKRAANPKPYGEVTYADPRNGKYPIDTEEHAKAAWSYINMPKNAAQYPMNGVTLASVKAKIVAALKKFGVKVSEQNAVSPGGERRDVVDGDNPNAAFYEIWADGAGPDLMQFVGTGELPPGIEDALTQIHEWCQEQTDHAASQDGTKDVSEAHSGDDGAFNAAATEQNAADDADWIRHAKLSIMQADFRKLQGELGV